MAPSGFHFQHFHLLDRLFCRRIFVFAVQAVENLEINADTYCPAGHYFSYLVVVERGLPIAATCGRKCSLQPNSFLGYGNWRLKHLAEQRIELGRQVFVIGYAFRLPSTNIVVTGRTLPAVRALFSALAIFDLQPGVLKPRSASPS